MALPKRNRRSITCDGRTYHWCFPQGRDFDHRSSYQLIIQTADGDGQLLKVLQPAWQIVTPAFVVATIKEALERGWRPDEALAPLSLTLTDA